MWRVVFCYDLGDYEGIQSHVWPLLYPDDATDEVFQRVATEQEHTMSSGFGDLNDYVFTIVEVEEDWPSL